jgi:hypothetical protein
LASNPRRQLPRNQRERDEVTDHEEKRFFLLRIALQLDEMLVVILEKLSNFCRQIVTSEVSK